MGWEINLMFVIGILAVIGYSVNNTVVVFDRIRENLTRGERVGFATTVNNSLVDTLSRSLNTSLTTLFVIVALLLFIGSSIQISRSSCLSASLPALTVRFLSLLLCWYSGEIASSVK
jgi:preprotein translocase subunit SecF